MGWDARSPPPFLNGLPCPADRIALRSPFSPLIYTAKICQADLALPMGKMRLRHTSMGTDIDIDNYLYV